MELIRPVMSRDEIMRLAARQLADYRALQPGTLFAESVSLTLDDAYAIQAEVARLREAAGETVAGYKVGCTSESVQERFGMRGPVSGFVFASELRASGIVLAATDFANLAVEAETAMRIGEHGDIVEVFPLIELHNFVFRGAPPTLAELVANNAVHAGAVLCDEAMPLEGLGADARLELVVDGEVVDAGDPFPMPGGAGASLAWLAGNLRRVGRSLRAGDIVLAGTPLGIHEVGPGRGLEARLRGRVARATVQAAAPPRLV